MDGGSARGERFSDCLSARWDLSRVDFFVFKNLKKSQLKLLTWNMKSFFWFQFNYDEQQSGERDKSQEANTRAIYVKHRSLSDCWYEDRDKASNWTAKLTIIESRIIYNHNYLFNNLLIEDVWLSIDGAASLASCRWDVFIYSSSFYFCYSIALLARGEENYLSEDKKRVKFK